MEAAQWFDFPVMKFTRLCDFHQIIFSVETKISSCSFFSTFQMIECIKLWLQNEWFCSSCDAKCVRCCFYKRVFERVDRAPQKVKKKKSVVLGRRQRQISKNTKKINQSSSTGPWIYISNSLSKEDADIYQKMNNMGQINGGWDERHRDLQTTVSSSYRCRAQSVSWPGPTAALITSMCASPFGSVSGLLVIFGLFSAPQHIFHLSHTADVVQNSPCMFSIQFVVSFSCFLLGFFFFSHSSRVVFLLVVLSGSCSSHS